MNIETLLHARDTRPAWRIGSHIIFWILFYSISVYLYKISFNPFGDLPLSYLEPLRRTLSLMVVYYPLVYVVGSRLFSKKRWLPGIGAALLLLLVYTLLDYAGEILTLRYCEVCDEAVAQASPEYHRYLQSGFLQVMVSRLLSLGLFFQLLLYMTIPLVVKAGLGFHRYYVRNLQLARDNVQLELDFLKAQVNPHFLFNTLNNLYSLILHGQKDKSAETVARLSDFMRYALYDSTEERVSLEKEINLIRNYIELEQLRLNHTQVVFNCHTDGKEYFLPPLLFMPVVENAFKYNVDRSAGATISITLKVEKDVLSFAIENLFEPNQTPAHSGGLGLTNLKKRLLLYFPDKNSFQTHIAGAKYAAQLTLKLI